MHTKLNWPWDNSVKNWTIPNSYDIESIDYSAYYKLYPLARSDSFERKCDECTNVARNEAKLQKHKELNFIYAHVAIQQYILTHYGDNILKKYYIKKSHEMVTKPLLKKKL